MKAEPEGMPRRKTAVEQAGQAAQLSRLPQQSQWLGEDRAPRLFQSHAFNIALLAAVMVVMFWRVFFAGETLIDAATLNNQLPWGYSAGASDYPYNRRDLTDMYVTRDYFVVSAYRDGEFPLWNPYTMAGHPIYADGVTRTLSPFLLFYKFFDVPMGYSLARIAELILAAIFMYIFLTKIGVSAGGSLLGALVFELSSHSMLHLTGLGWWGGLMWLPLIILFVDRAIERNSVRQATIAGALLAAQFFCGYMPNQIYYVGAVVLYYLFFGLAQKRSLVSISLKRCFGLMLTTLITGLALAATQWIPMLELLKYSNRKVVGAELAYIYLPPWYGLTLVFPNLFGEAYDTRTLTLFTALGVSHDHILYLSIAALLPLAFSLRWLWQRKAKSRRRKADGEADDAREVETALAAAFRFPTFDLRVQFFALLAAISLVIMMAAPLYVPVTRFVPILQVIRVAVRAGVLFLFAAAVLVAAGADLLMRAGTDELMRFARLARRFFFAALGLALAAIIASYVIKATGFAIDASERGRLAFIRKAVAALASQFTPPDLSIIAPLALMLVVSVSLWFTAREKLSRKTFFAILVTLLVADLFWASGQFNHSFERSRIFPETEITDTLRGLPPGRTLVVPSDLETNRRASSETDKIIAPPNTLLPYQISTVTGKNQQFPKWYREFAALIEPQPNLSHVVFDQTHSRFFDLLNVRYVMTHAQAPRLEGYDLITTAEGIALYENKNAMPRAFFARRTVESPTHEDAINEMRNPAFDPKTTAIIEMPDNKTRAQTTGAGEDNGEKARAETQGPPPATQSSIVSPLSAEEAEIISDERNALLIETSRAEAATLVLSDNYYPGWAAYVDGQPVEVFRANCSMRAVKVPAGRHMILFEFAPAAFYASIYLSVAAAAIVAAGMFFGSLRRNQPVAAKE
jgi:membrane protein YfhO